MPALHYKYMGMLSLRFWIILHTLLNHNYKQDFSFFEIQVIHEFHCNQVPVNCAKNKGYKKESQDVHNMIIEIKLRYH